MIRDFSRIVRFVLVKGPIPSKLNCAVLCNEAAEKLN